MLSVNNSSIPKEDNRDNKKKELPEKQDIVINDGKYTPEILWSMGRILSFEGSSINNKIIYSIAYYSVKENTEHTVIHIMDANGKNDTLLTTSSNNESSPQWIKEGKKIAFLSNQSGSSQIWEMNPDGTQRKQQIGRAHV